MTYADWAAEDRLPRTADDYLEIEARMIGTSPFLRRWLQNRPVAGTKLIDIGCGSGVLSCRLAREGANVVGIDLTQTGASMAKRNAQIQGANVVVARMDAEHMAFADATFDFAFSWGVLHHSADMEGAVREVLRILKPNGRGLIMVYHRHSIAYYMHGLYWLFIKGHFFRGYRMHNVQDLYTDGYFHRYLTRAELAKLVSDAGASIERISVTQYEAKIIPGLPAVIDEWLKRKFGMLVIAEFQRVCA